METVSALLAICAGNSPVSGEFPAQRPVTRGFDVFFDLSPDKQLSKQSWGWCFETPSHSLWRHCNDVLTYLALIPAWISNYIHNNVWDEMTYPFWNFYDCTVEVWEWISNFIPHFTGHVITYPVNKEHEDSHYWPFMRAQQGTISWMYFHVMISSSYTLDSVRNSPVSMSPLHGN